MYMQGTVGPIGPVADGSTPAGGFRQGKTGELVNSPYLPDYAEAVLRDRVFHVSNQAAQAVSVALATTYTGLCLSNPNASGVNLVLLTANWALSVAPAAIASLHLIKGFSTTDVTHTAAVTPQSSLIGSAAVAAAKADSQATISTPLYAWSLGSGFTAGALYATTPGVPHLKGMYVIKPGGFIAFGALTAVTGFGSFCWMEVPV